MCLIFFFQLIGNNMPLCHKCASNHFAAPSALLLSMITVAISFNSLKLPYQSQYNIIIWLICLWPVRSMTFGFCSSCVTIQILPLPISSLSLTKEISLGSATPLFSTSSSILEIGRSVSIQRVSAYVDFSPLLFMIS